MLKLLTILTMLYYRRQSALAAWADEWQLSVSIDKCGVLCVGKGVCSAPQQFKLHDSPLP